MPDAHSRESSTVPAQDFNAELHARPSIYFSGPAIVSHIAFLLPPETIDCGRLETRIRSLLGAANRHLVEFHTEFVTVTAVEPVSDVWCRPATRKLLDPIADLLSTAGAQPLNQLTIIVTGPMSEEAESKLSAIDIRAPAASLIGGADAAIFSDFRVGSDGASRIVLFNTGLNEYRLGRMVRRLCEIETYRTAALIGLPLARSLHPVLIDFERRLLALSEENLTPGEVSHRDLLARLTQLSALIDTRIAKTRARFGATSAYAQIVEERIGELRETRVAGHQRYGVFVIRRFRPAVRTCAAAGLRLDQISAGAFRLLELLRTRVEVDVEYQNTRLMQIMAKRARTQLKIQRTVEGLSFVAISYYAVGLLEAAADALRSSGVDLPQHTMTVAIPAVIAASGFMLQRLKSHLSR